MGSLSSGTSDLHKLRALEPAERRLLAGAAVLLPAIVVLLKLTGYQRLHRLGERAVAPRPLPADADARIDRTVRMVDLTIARLPIPSACLSQSLTLWLLLRAQGVPSEVCIGVRPGGAPLDAHAWVEHEGRPLNETESVVSSYAALRRGAAPG